MPGTTGILSGILSGIYSDMPSGVRSGIILSGTISGAYSDILPGTLSATELWLSQLSSGARDCGVPTELRRSPLRSGSAHWDWSSLFAELWSSRLRSGSDHWDLELTVGAEAGKRQRRAREEGRLALIKSRDPHLAGVEKGHRMDPRAAGNF